MVVLEDKSSGAGSSVWDTGHHENVWRRLVYRREKEVDVAVYGGSLYTDEVYEVIRGGRYAARYLRGAVAIVILARRLWCVPLRRSRMRRWLPLSCPYPPRAFVVEGKPGSYS